MALIMNKFALHYDRYWSFGEYGSIYKQDNVFYIDIHLGIQTPILCCDNRPKDYVNFTKMRTANQIPSLIFDWGSSNTFAPPEASDVSATLYLGKITFSRNKQGNLTPVYIPSSINESSFEELNPFWLNEINPTPMAEPTYPRKNLELRSTGQYPTPYIDLEGYKYQKIYYYRNKHNITLNKEQILSYFTELHTKNTQFIQAYIDEINKNKGIKAYTNIESYYDKLAKEGIIPPNLLSKYNDGTYKQNKEADLIVLDYLKSNNEADSMILLSDELFYAYLFLSLYNFIIMLPSGKFCEENNLILNAGAYKKYNILTVGTEDNYTLEHIRAGVDAKKIKFFNNRVTQVNAKEEQGTLFFGNVGLIYIESNFGSNNLEFKTPNRVYENYPKTGQPIFDDKPQPSSLGNYYFELSDNPDTYIEYFQRIYPSITNPPKAWTKEMMKKLDLKLE